MRELVLLSLLAFLWWCYVGCLGGSQQNTQLLRYTTHTSARRSRRPLKTHRSLPPHPHPHPHPPNLTRRGPPATRSRCATSCCRATRACAAACPTASARTATWQRSPSTARRWSARGRLRPRLRALRQRRLPAAGGGGAAWRGGCCRTPGRARTSTAPTAAPTAPPVRPPPSTLTRSCRASSRTRRATTRRPTMPT